MAQLKAEADAKEETAKRLAAQLEDERQQDERGHAWSRRSASSCLRASRAQRLLRLSQQQQQISPYFGPPTRARAGRRVRRDHYVVWDSVCIVWHVCMYVCLARRPAAVRAPR